jgi:hypothetical protein
MHDEGLHRADPFGCPVGIQLFSFLRLLFRHWYYHYTMSLHTIERGSPIKQGKNTGFRRQLPEKAEYAIVLPLCHRIIS